MPRTITVETELNANYPDEAAFREFGGLLVLQTACSHELMLQGCEPESIKFAEPFRDGDLWKIHGTGKVKD